MFLDTDVTTGRPELPTPAGDYHIFAKYSPYQFISPWPYGSPFWYPSAWVKYAMEFIGKMTYLDNWASEMHERFCFWDFQEWQSALRAAGFRILPGSHPYANPWRVEHHFKARVALYEVDSTPLPFPDTNMVLAGEKL